VNSLKTVSPFNGYWIKVNSTPEDQGLLIVGSKVTGCNPLTLKIVPVNQHWIGYWLDTLESIRYWLDTPKSPAKDLSSITGNYEIIRTYKNGVWETYYPSLPQFSDLKEMKPGQAFIIKMINQDNLDYNLSCI
jgi:hypothetical protein